MDSLLGAVSEYEEWLLAHGFVKDGVSDVWTFTGRPRCLDFLDDWDIKVFPVTGGEWEARVWYGPKDGRDDPKHTTRACLTPRLAVLDLVEHLENTRIASWTAENLQKMLDGYFPAHGEEKDPGLRWLSERGFAPSPAAGRWSRTVGEAVVRMVKDPDGRWWARCVKEGRTVNGPLAAGPKEALMDLLAVLVSRGDCPFTEDEK